MPNASNNYWFNSVVQEIQSIVSCSSMRKCLQNAQPYRPFACSLLSTFVLRIRFLKTFSLQFVRVWPRIPSLSGMSQNFSCFMTGLLKWRTAVRIRTFGWLRPDLVSLSKMYSIPRSLYPKCCDFGRISKALTPRQLPK